MAFIWAVVGELIHEVVLAMQAGIKTAQLSATIHATRHWHRSIDEP